MTSYSSVRQFFHKAMGDVLMVRPETQADGRLRSFLLFSLRSFLVSSLFLYFSYCFKSSSAFVRVTFAFAGARHVRAERTLTFRTFLFQSFWSFKVFCCTL